MSMAADRAVTPAAERKRRQRARIKAAREIEFVRANWALFLHPDRLPQKAGCPRDRLQAMILKELADNPLDAGVDVRVDQIDPNTWAVTDDGSGLDRGQIVRLFAVNRPMTSTKLVRRPTRGAIGNGLRVVTGGVLASGGRLTVESRGGRYLLHVRSGARGRPPLGLGGPGGSSGSTAAQRSSGTRGVIAPNAFGPVLSRPCPVETRIRSVGWACSGSVGAGGDVAEHEQIGPRRGP